MHIKTIFNRVTEYKPFIVDRIDLVEHKLGPVMEVTMRARGNRQPQCSGRGERCPGLSDTFSPAANSEIVPSPFPAKRHDPVRSNVNERTLPLASRSTETTFRDVMSHIYLWISVAS